jgi:TRAP transporter TAXI family solute receptor
MAKLGGNSVITEILSIVNHLLFAQPAVRNSIRRNMNTIVHHHMNFIKALEKKDSLLAEQSMKECLSLLGQQGGVAIVYDTFSTGSIGGSFYSAGRELCRILNEYGGMPIESEPSGGGIENVELTSEGKAVLGLTQSDIAFHAFNGTNPFFEPHEQIRAVCGAHQLDLWIVVSASSPLFNLNDLHGKRIAMGALGGESSLIAKALLDVYGYTDGDYRSFYLSISNAVNGMLHSEIDAIFYLSGGPGSALNELSENIPLRFLSIDETHTNSILKTHPYWKKSIIKKDSWPDLKEDVPTLSISSLLITHKDVPNQIIKIITSVIMEHAEEINFDYINGTSYGINNALQGIPIPLHPGAEEYYRGNGLEL